MVLLRVARAAFLVALIATCHACTSAGASEPSGAGEQPQVIALQHVDCETALAAVRELNEDNELGSKLVVVAHPSSNSLLLSGQPDAVAQAVDLVARLDVETR